MPYFTAKVVVIDDITKKVSKAAQSVYQDELVRGQGILADSTNGKYEKWNAEYDAIYPNIDEDKTDPESNYMKFMVEKMNNAIKNATPKSWRVNYYYVNEEGCISIDTIEGRRYSLLLKEVKLVEES